MQQMINVGAAPNDHTGDSLRESQIKANANFTELFGLSSAPIGFLELRMYMKGAQGGVPNVLSTLEPGDFVRGLKDANTLWESAMYLGGPIGDRANYTPIIEVDITGIPF